MMLFVFSMQASFVKCLYNCRSNVYTLSLINNFSSKITRDTAVKIHQFGLTTIGLGDSGDSLIYCDSKSVDIVIVTKMTFMIVLTL